MKENFSKLIEIIDTLLSENGCPWDKEQTLLSMRKSLLEETYEVIEAINEGREEELMDELGDLLFNALFLCRLAEKEKKGSLSKALGKIEAKLIRRHPHIFKNVENLTSKDVLNQWNKIKEQEKGSSRKIPKSLPTLIRAQKFAKAMKDSNQEKSPTLSEALVGKELYLIIQKAEAQGIDAEQALHLHLSYLEPVIAT